MSFEGGIRRQTDALRAKLDQAATIAVHEVERSLVEGSPITGSLGTPVDTGFARNSWTRDGVPIAGASVRPVRAGDTVTIRAGAVYMRALEEGRRTVGGRVIALGYTPGRSRSRTPWAPGWVALTKAQWPAIMRHALRTVGLLP